LEVLEILTDYLRRAAMNQWWVVAIEFLLIGLVVYWAVDFLEGTRGERLFRGVIFILIVGFIVLKLVVGQFAFERLQFLYNGFLIFVLIIAVAGFQPEIRRALIRIGQPRFLTGVSRQMSKTVEAIVAAAEELSAKRIGAVIVIERRVALGEFIETGTRLNAEITPELLRTIFYPGTPLHDMAVVVRDDKVIAARVQLPLAEAESKGTSELGSRHRAAAGITMGSDAICVVLSEETGIISVAQDGKLKRDLTEGELRHYLISALGATAPSTFGGFRDHFRGKGRKRDAKAG
jgi:diadenylate cyclase